MNTQYKFLIGLALIVALLCGLNGCMSQELKTALSDGDAQLVSQIVQTNPNDLSGASLKDYRLHGLELHDLTITNVDMFNLDLQGAKLTNVTFEDCTLTGVDFSNSEFHNVRFMNTTLEPIGTTRYDVKETTFKNSLLDKVGFGDGSKLLDVLLHSLAKGSSLAIVDCTIEVVVEGHSYVFYDSYLENLLIDRTDVEEGVALSLAIFGGENVVIKNSSLTNVDFYGVEAKNLLIKNNRDSLLRVGGEFENVKVVGNSDSLIVVDGAITTAYASDNGGKNSDVSFGGDIGEVLVKDGGGLSVCLSRGKIKSAVVSNCNNMVYLELKSVIIDELKLSTLDAEEINSAETLIKKLSIEDVVLKERSWVRDTTVVDVSVENLTISPDVRYDESYKETEGFWNDLLSKQ
ncbi:pentapeptide repeat-containing protein [Halodesulfovibrio sp. MK-HDV]|jgi:uncharacterized protein YjbI with pentapeptide repeats|uniref:pentapeptide repeat-containing protein n=1 Tax=Halodesulfovibrio sp. MK-HDV TaxID=2599925 RepID=UPI00136C53AE|nr:pentapeptide repeat-containing protein [Halodesulfovibrio sp. MK-HDV]KAF1077696.1 hypothetical protein MKHDV_00153 [Halodesulfovibrio sp. MK-HDV]